MKKILLAASAILFSVILPIEVKAVNFSGLYVFGDSLSDMGNVFNASGNIFPPFPYSDGRFTNGKVWVQYLADDLGLPITNYLAGGTNFAFGGALTGIDPATGIENTISNALPGVQTEVGIFKSLLGSNPADPNGLYILWAGANDYLPTNSSFSPYTNPTQTVANLSGEITALAQVGAKNILVVNLPDLGQTPRANNLDPTSPVPSGTSLALTKISSDHDTDLALAINNLKPILPSDINLISFDISALFDKIISNHLSFGLTNTSNGCIFTPACVGSPEQQNQYFFWDGIHPTTAVHQIIGKSAFNLVNVPEPSTILGLLTFGIIGTGISWKRYQEQKKSDFRG